MKYLLIALTLAFCSCSTTVRHRTAPIKAPSVGPVKVRVEKAKAAVTRAQTHVVKERAIAKRIEVKAAELPPTPAAVEIRTLSLELQVENEKVTLELAEAQAAHVEALERTEVLQTEVNEVTSDRNAQAKAKDKAEAAADYWKKKHGEAVKKLWWWRLRAGGAALVGVLLIMAGLAMKYTAWGARNITPLLL